jgi:phytanoyl-CoA hydroxylase
MLTSHAAPLAQEEVERFLLQGYLVVPNLLSEEEIEAFVRYEAESKHQGPRGLQNHKTDPQWAQIAGHRSVTAIAAQLLEGEPRIVQTMYMAKAAAGGTGVALHQDTHYIRNLPNSLMACWIAFNDTDRDNGGLCVVPGSNHEGLQPTAAVSTTDEHAAWEQVYAMSDADGNQWDETMRSFDIVGLDRQRVLYLEVPRGAGVFFTGMTIHGSFANRSAQRQRLAFATHFIRQETWIYRSDLQETTALDTLPQG